MIIRSFEHDSGAMDFRLRRARRVIPKGVKLPRKHRSCHRLWGDETCPPRNFLYKSCYYKGRRFIRVSRRRYDDTEAPSS